LVEKRDGHNLLLEEVKTNISNIKAKQVKLRSIGDKINSSFSDINYLLRSYKSKIDELKSKSKDKKDSVNVEEFEKTISEMDEKKNNSHTKISDCKEKELYYKELNRILSEGGVKKSIISGIIKPINHFIDENVKKMRLPFVVKLNETFTAEIKSLGSKIEHDTLSTGETKKDKYCYFNSLS